LKSMLRVHSRKKFKVKVIYDSECIVIYDISLLLKLFSDESGASF